MATFEDLRVRVVFLSMHALWNVFHEFCIYAWFSYLVSMLRSHASLPCSMSSISVLHVIISPYQRPLICLHYHTRGHPVAGLQFYSSQNLS